MKIVSLGSSSNGNSYILNDGASLLMLECGFKYKPLVTMMREKNLSPAQLSGVLISHEHHDHAECWEKLVEYGLKVYATAGTIKALSNKNEVLAGQLIPLDLDPNQNYSPPLRIGSYDVMAFRTFHDANEPVGFLIRSQEDEEKLVFATDTVNLNYQFENVARYMLEANYSEELAAKNDRIPESVLRRIRNNHMELHTLCRYLSGLNLAGCKAIYLMHLSDHSSYEPIFYRAVRAVVPEDVKVYIFDKGGPPKKKKRR